jgi:proteasome lid subunit RPN8/RPN11
MLRIGEAQLQVLRRHGEEAYPAESCGVLLGPPGVAGARPREVTRALRCANAAAEPRRHFEIDPHDLLRIARASRAAGEEIVGFYHSHPDGPAEPSPSDLDCATWPGCTAVITGVVAGRAAETRGFVLRAGVGDRPAFHEEPLAAEGR